LGRGDILSEPAGVATDRVEHDYVVDSGLNAVQKLASH
jgi:hypothetical protein